MVTSHLKMKGLQSSSVYYKLTLSCNKKAYFMTIEKPTNNLDHQKIMHQQNEATSAEC